MRLACRRRKKSGLRSMGSSRVVAALANALTRLTQLLERGVAVVQFLPCLVLQGLRDSAPRQLAMRSSGFRHHSRAHYENFTPTGGPSHINLCVKCVVVTARPFLNTVAADRTFLRF